MPKTNDLKDLPFVDREVEDLEKLLLSAIKTTVSNCPTKSDVLSLLPDHHVVHLSCHEKFLPEDPSHSKYFLSDWQTSPLTVSELTPLNMPTSLFAYLSACHTSSTRNMRLLDESINLASIFQLAGYSSVVGTLWQVRDEYSPVVAIEVYSMMVNDWTLESQRPVCVEQSCV